MHISECEIKSYKCFRQSGTITLGPGFNVVVGQNSAGKTALLEMLSLEFKNSPHKSLENYSTENSSISVRLKVNGGEGLRFLRALPAFGIPAPRGAEAALKSVQDYFEKPFEVSVTHSIGSQLMVELLGFSSVGGRFLATLSKEGKVVGSGGGGGPVEQVGTLVFKDMIRSRYIFRAERLNIHQGPTGTNTVLAPNAQNLPEVLNMLQGSNRPRFQRFVNAVCKVFPEIRDVAIVLIANSVAEVRISFAPPESERPDLAIPLSDCGTGIGQVLAMLYVIINSDEPRTILIDEPQSFLHPGAIRKLFEVFKQEERHKHQYVITTHSPTVITACSPCNVVLLRRDGNESKAEIIDMNETNALRLSLSEIGASLSDVFGAERILWVEGKTEELCFRLIVQKLIKIELLGTDILAVRSVGDLTGRHKEIVLDIYKNLSRGRGLLPPALGFCFDREGLSEAEMRELQSESNDLIHFIPRRMFENYLLNTDAIASVLNEVDTGNGIEHTGDAVNVWLQKNMLLPKYIDEADRGQWLQKVHAAKLLNDLFDELTGARVHYDKIKHGMKLTNFIIEKSPEDLAELGQFLIRLIQPAAGISAQK